MKFKQILIVSAMLCATGCASNGQDNQVDHGDGVDTPDVLLQDTSGKSVSYGETEFGLAPDAKSRDQQIKPDPLIAGINTTQKSAPPQAVVPTPAAEPAQPVVKPPKAEKAPVPEPEPAEKPQKVDKPKKKEVERLKRDSALEVADPLLGEVEPK